MHAAVLHTIGTVPRYEEFLEPVIADKDGEVIVHVHAASRSRSRGFSGPFGRCCRAESTGRSLSTKRLDTCFADCSRAQDGAWRALR